MAGGGESNGDPTLSPVELMLRYLESLPQEFSFREEIRSPKFWKALRAELLASLLLVIFLTGSSIAPPTGDASNHPNNNCTSRPPSSADREFRLALAYCMTTATLIQCFGNISGAQMNPAVTISMLVTRYISPLRAGAYFIVQLAASLAGALIVYGLTPKDWPTSAQVAAVGEGVSLTQAFGVEFLATFLVVVTTLAALDPVRQDVGCKALSVGLAYGVGALFSYQLTGAGMNPVRTFGPAVVYANWTNHWVYWVGPGFGGILGGFTYEFVHDSSPHGRCLHRSFRRRRPDPSARGHLGREVSGISSGTTEFLQPVGTEDHSAASRH